MTTTYEYDFVRIKLKGGTWNGKFSEEYQEIIRDRAYSGWRFVQGLAPAVAGYGAARYLDLIFERPAS